MATGSAASSASGSRGARSSASGGGDARPLCPFCRTPTVVERMSKTLKHPDIPFYTCTNRGWGKSNCQFFMWKPASNDVVVDVPTLVAGLRALENSVEGATKAVAALGVDVRSMAGQQRSNKRLLVAGLVGVVIFVFLCMYYKA